MSTVEQYQKIIDQCKEIFLKKTADYGTSWRVLRPLSVVDQIYIKAYRIRTIQEVGKQKITDDITGEFIGIINYAVIGLIQLELTEEDEEELTVAQAASYYQNYVTAAQTLMVNKNHDYGEAWRQMSEQSFVDLILMKLLRMRQILINDGKTLISEGLDANYYDMLNYAVFALILRAEKKFINMKLLIRIVQLLVALLFIFSGLIKANDPLGLSYKMQEFFELWLAGFSKGSFIANALHFFHHNALTLSVAMITLEVMAGVALLTGWKRRAVLWLLLVLIVFFTFLTGYAYLSGKFTNCGCFGDCLPITPLTSFTKDIVLLLLILLLLFQSRYIISLLQQRTAIVILLVSMFISLGLQWYCLKNLPLADCLPFKKGNNIAQQMQTPAGSLPDSFAIRFLYEKGGKNYEFAPENLPADFTTYKFIDRKQTLVRKGNADPPIKGFSLLGADTLDLETGNFKSTDSTMIVLNQPLAIIGFGLDSIENNEWIPQLKSITQAAKQKNIPVYFATNEKEKFIQYFLRNNIGIQVFATDFTVIRTAARTNPTFYILKSGTVVKKISWRQLKKLRK